MRRARAVPGVSAVASGVGPKANGGDRKRQAAVPPAPAGLPAREAAVRLISAVMHRQRSLDDALAKEFASDALAPRDRALARLIAGTVLRHAGELRGVLSGYLEKPLPQQSGNLWPILLAGAAQLLFLETPPHAAVGLAVEQARKDRHARRYDRLVNALLRRVSREGASALEGRDGAHLNVPAWMFERWSKTYGEADARRIALASLCEAPLDLSVKADPALWAERLGGTALATGSVRIAAGGRIEDLAGYADGAWWVQDAAAALPARLIGDVVGRSVADLCAAPGGKTAELAAAGANVSAVELSAARLDHLRANLDRLHLQADLVEADAATWAPGKLFDAVLLDAPCTSTGTIRRHPDILHLKRADDVAVLAALQSRLLDNAARLVKPGGVLVYCTCSLEPEEGADQIARLLARDPGFVRLPIAPGDCGIPAEWITAVGDLRTLPFHLPQPQKELSGLDGFYAARLSRRA
jgi:16S rRNA (cytosine967-C5)-methyltransferase